MLKSENLIVINYNIGIFNPVSLTLNGRTDDDLIEYFTVSIYDKEGS